MKLKSVHLFFLVFLCSSFCYSQFISGGVIGEFDQSPIEGATVQLLDKDSIIRASSITDRQGHFFIKLTATGYYRISITASGWRNYVSEKIHARATADTLILSVQLSPKKKLLDSVVITTTRAFIEIKPDKRVINVEAMANSAGVNLAELLQQTPAVTLDDQGNISLDGKPGVLIYIDGKPSYIKGSNLLALLKTMSGSTVEQVELISNASSRYDAEGNGGIINIITKKNKKSGFHTDVNSEWIIGRYPMTNNDANFAYVKGRFNLNFAVSYSFWDNFNDINDHFSFRQNNTTLFNHYLIDTSFEHFIVYVPGIRISLDYSLNKGTTMGISGQLNLRRDKSLTHSNSDGLDSNYQFLQNNTSTINRHSRWLNPRLGWYLKKSFETNSQLTMEFDFTSYLDDRNFDLQTSNYDKDANQIGNNVLQKNVLNSVISIVALKTDYSRKISKNTVMESGLKFSSVEYDNNALYFDCDSPTGQWFKDTLLSNRFLYHETVNAAYLRLQAQLSKWNIQVGARGEQTITKGGQNTQMTAFSKTYFGLFPTLFISYKADNKNTWGISLARRLNRPRYQALNPFTVPINNYTFTIGNPNLRPQYSTNIELNYGYKGAVFISAHYTISSGIMGDIGKVMKQPADSTYKLYWTTINLAKNYNVGVSTSYTAHLFKWWQQNLSVVAFNTHYIGILDSISINESRWTLQTNMTNQIILKNGWRTELGAVFYSGRLSGINLSMYPTGMFTLGCSKQLIHKNGVLRIIIRDPAKWYKAKMHLETDRSIQLSERFWNVRSVTLSFTYHFGGSLKSNSISSADEEIQRSN